MKALPQYLAEYIDHESSDGVLPEDVEILKNWIKNGIDAYQSAENCEIQINPAQPQI